MYIQVRFIHAQPHLSSRIRQDKSHTLIYIYAAIRVAPDLKLSLSTTSRLQTHSHVHLPIYVYSSAFHTYSTTFVIPYTQRFLDSLTPDDWANVEDEEEEAFEE